MSLDDLAVLLSRCALVLLFLPFSALDKLLNFRGAVTQAKQAVAMPALAGVMVLLGLATEVLCSLSLLTGVADRLGAVVLAGYCAVTALLFKRFWAAPDFRLRGPSQGRDVFWDFLKNIALAGALVALALSGGVGLRGLLADPLSSTHPYQHRTLP